MLQKKIKRNPYRKEIMEQDFNQPGKLYRAEKELSVSDNLKLLKQQE